MPFRRDAEHFSRKPGIAFAIAGTFSTDGGGTLDRNMAI